MQIHSFDAVVSEKDAVIQEVSALRCFIINFTVTVKLFVAVPIILYTELLESTEHLFRNPVKSYLLQPPNLFLKSKNKTLTGLVLCTSFYRRAGR